MARLILPTIMTAALMALPAYAQEAEAPDDGLSILLIVLLAVGVLVAIAAFMSAIRGKPDPETREEYPLPLDLDED